jgi:hypothetical protein
MGKFSLTLALLVTFIGSTLASDLLAQSRPGARVGPVISSPAISARPTLRPAYNTFSGAGTAPSIMSVSPSGVIRQNAVRPTFNTASGLSAAPRGQFSGAAGMPAPRTLITPNGQRINPPTGSVGPFPTIGRNNTPNGGVFYTNGASPASTLRVMPPRAAQLPSRSRPSGAPAYPNGYGVFENGRGQAVIPNTRTTAPPSATHIPF